MKVPSSIQMMINGTVKFSGSDEVSVEKGPVFDNVAFFPRCEVF